ncbi:MAG: transcription termination/antitermination NusG family protein [Ferrimonas sp.]
MQNWYLLYCKSAREAAVQSWFEQMGLGVFLPTIEVEQTRKYSRNGVTKSTTKKVQKPLFPNYLFVRFDPHITPYSSVNGAPNVGGIVRTNGQLQAVELSLIMSLRARLAQLQQANESAPLGAEPEPLQEGEPLLITDGPFANLEAIFAEPDGDKRSILLIHILGQAQRLSTDNLSFQRMRKPKRG